jgi:Fe-S oxidoreductase
MCPSFQATRDEKDSTRGRARVLQEMVNGAPGSPVRDGWSSPEVHEALDLCLSCKGCASDCPTGVDMATYKAEALHQRYRGRLRPRSHYALGALPRWLRLTRAAAPLAARTLRSGLVQRVARAAAGVDQRRDIPTPAPESLATWAARSLDPAPTGTGNGAGNGAGADGTHGTRPLDVVVWADTFTDHFTPDNARAALSVLARAGLRAGVTGTAVCCGLTWVSTGQLDTARRELTKTVRALEPHAAAGTRILVLEPSCLATLRTDAAELLSGADREVAGRVAAATRTLAELLAELPDWTPPDLSGTEILVQPHCHHASVLGWEADARLLAATGARVTRVDGCCGLAGNWGVEQGHHEVSVAVASTHLLPAVHAAAPGTVVLADGFSCRTQLAGLAATPSRHLAELLAEAGDGVAGS